jgi:hypothetical protein
MKRRWKIAAGLAVLTIVAVCLFSRPGGALRDLQDTRRALREQGFKLELREFDLSLPPELSRSWRAKRHGCHGSVVCFTRAG